MKRRTVKTAALYLLMIVIALIFILPICILFVNSFKLSNSQILRDMNSFRIFLPVGELGLNNYAYIFERVDIMHYFKNSVIIFLASLVLGAIVNSTLGYALSRLEFKGRKFIISLVISLMIIPTEAIMIPLLLMCHNMGLINTLTVQFLPFLAGPFAIFLFYQGFLSLPSTIEEAAVIDGCSYIRIYTSIVVPLSKPTFVSVLILCSLGSWGDVLWATMVTRGKAVRPISVGMAQIFQTLPVQWGQVFAFAVVMTIPILLFFMIFQKHFIASTIASGVKG